MQNLYDMIAAQNQAAVDALSRQFKLSQDQTREAVGALMPAFSTALRRNTADPLGLQSFLGALANGGHGRYYDRPEEATSAQAREDGNGVLGHLFGSKEASRAIAAQAAQATGIGEEVLRQMLPALAAMVMGGLFKQATQRRGRGDMLRDIIEEMMGAGLAPGARGAGERLPGRNDPYSEMFDRFMGGEWSGAGADQHTRHRQPEPPTGDDLFGPMFEAGREVSEGYRRGMESVVEGYLRGMDRFNRR